MIFGRFIGYVVSENAPLVYEMKTIGCPTAVQECTMWKIRVLLTFPPPPVCLFDFDAARCLFFFRAE